MIWNVKGQFHNCAVEYQLKAVCKQKKANKRKVTGKQQPQH